MFRCIMFIGLALLTDRSVPTAGGTSTSPSTSVTAPDSTCVIATATSVAQLRRNPAPTCILATATSSASPSAVTEPASTTEPSLSSVALTSTTTLTSPPASQTTSSTPPSQSTTLSPDAVPQTSAYAAFQLRSSVELSSDEIIAHVEKFVEHFQANFSGAVKITLKKSEKLLA
ncbi:integumentary mucin C.1-like [Puntigrus tetrazona]|uniref:integumentary mucin C.1-like n=1 Tax=Puntigrus tetrazona TaxID=1606681 RepID=UPI001C897D57|nr:integumentary mucin C.1-like [Puntigrus tetrazona]